MNRPISDIMDKDVYTCHYSQTLEEAVKILVDKKVGGLTVIDDNRHVIDFISDLVQPIGEVAEILSSKKIKKIPIVTADGALVGVARRSTIMRYIFNMLFNSDDARISNV